MRFKIMIIFNKGNRPAEMMPGKVSKESIQSSTTPDLGHHMGKRQNTKNITHKPRNRLAYQWLDNSKLNKYAKYDLNIP